LQEWSADKADQLIARIENHLKLIADDPLYQSVYGYANYIEQFEYAAFAQSEALLRFPDAPQANGWRWNRAYNTALSYPFPESEDAPELQQYGMLLTSALNADETSVDDLPRWFASHEARLTLHVTAIDPPKGYKGSYVVELRDGDAGEAHLWLLEDDKGFEAYNLLSSLFFFRGGGGDFETKDLTGDGYPELILHYWRNFCCGFVTGHYIFDLMQAPPHLLPILRADGKQFAIGSLNDSHILNLETGESPGFLFKSTPHEPYGDPCTLWKFGKFRWDGEQFVLNETYYDIEPPDAHDNKELCQFVIDTASNPDELAAVVPAISNVRESGSPLQGKRDEVRYRLGEYYARLGNAEKAASFFSELIAHRDMADNGPWLAAAQTFLDRYKSVDDYYSVCVLVAPCDRRTALEQVAESIPSERYPLALDDLRQLGVPIASSGFFDFSGYESAEQWFTVKHPDQTEREFWILVRGPKSVQALFVSELSTPRPSLEYGERQDTARIILLNKAMMFSVAWLSGNQRAFISNMQRSSVSEDESMQTFFRQTLAVAAEDLFAEVDPAQIRDVLLSLQKSPAFDCKTLYVCPKFYYLLGLTYELAGNERAAIDTYMQLWREYPDSAYTIMVRAKLKISP
jgi:hypothetical protein